MSTSCDGMTHMIAQQRKQTCWCPSWQKCDSLLVVWFLTNHIVDLCQQAHAHSSSPSLCSRSESGPLSSTLASFRDPGLWQALGIQAYRQLCPQESFGPSELRLKIAMFSVLAPQIQIPSLGSSRIGFSLSLLRANSLG